MTERGPGRPGEPSDMPPHADLLDHGRQAAAVLARCGVQRGSRVAVLLPPGPRSVALTLACLRLDAVRVSLSLTESAGWLRDRLRGCGAQLVITADHCHGHGGVVPVKAVLDQALAGCPDVSTVLVVPELPRPVPWTAGRDHWWDALLPSRTATVPQYPGAMTGTTPPSPDEPVRRGTPARIVFDDPLLAASDDDLDRGWGEPPSTGDGPGDDIARFLRDKPPHHA